MQAEQCVGLLTMLARWFASQVKSPSFHDAAPWTSLDTPSRILNTSEGNLVSKICIERDLHLANEGREFALEELLRD